MNYVVRAKRDKKLYHGYGLFVFDGTEAESTQIAQKYFNDYTPAGYFVFMMTDSELYRAPTSHRFAKEQYPERSTNSVQSYINVYQGTVSSSFPYNE